MNPASNDRPPRRGFQLGWRDLWMVAGFLFAVVVADRALDASPYDVVLPVEHSQNQIQLLAQRLRPEPPDVLLVGSSRVEAGVHPGAIAAVLSSPEGGPSVARLPVMGLHAIALLQVVRDLVVPAPPKELLVVGLEERYFFRMNGETDDQLGLRLMGTARDLALVPPGLLRAHDWPSFLGLPFRGVRAAWQVDFLFDDAVEPYLEHLWSTGGLSEYPLRAFGRRDLALAVGLAESTRRRAARGDDDPLLLPAELHAFRRTLDLLEGLPCRVVFVRMPVAPSHEVEYAEEFAAYRAEVVRDVERRGFRVFDLNDVPLLRVPALLQNPTHLNPTGRVAASRALALAVVGPLVLGDRFGAERAAALRAMVATGGLSLRPAPGVLPEPDEAGLEAAVRAEVARRAAATAAPER